ncbi:hypothetical protein M2447_000298 [Ereboglobus sp. PH5-10]|uniref:hypothetical protein n=1 Tax=Ereboglobus sp. PH5-10 TaxID=2940629 RepID=UPI002405E8BE|nr:hypothetical protein [Ereboglobus sp. PH5-10]MDF9826222.1 hypothetical protein [Ereboglobus sp. PH5-10]
MTQEETNKVVEHLKIHWAGKACPYCQNAHWVVPESIFQLIEFHKDGVSLGGPVVPVIPITCKKCGNTALVNALTVGVVQSAREVSNG